MSAADRLEDAEVQVSRLARAVALKRAVVTATAGFVLAFAVSRGWITADLSDQANSYLADALTFLTTVGAGAWIHHGTTPAAQDLQPVNSEGQLLIPLGQLPPRVDLNGDLSTDSVGDHAAPDPTAHTDTEATA